MPGIGGLRGRGVHRAMCDGKSKPDEENEAEILELLLYLSEAELSFQKQLPELF